MSDVGAFLLSVADINKNVLKVALIQYMFLQTKTHAHMQNDLKVKLDFLTLRDFFLAQMKPSLFGRNTRFSKNGQNHTNTLTDIIL